MRRVAWSNAAMDRILPALADWPLYGVAASRRIEAEALARAEPQALMRRAGAAVAKLALAVAPHAQRIWVAAGPGNNGGDGLEAACHLHQPDRPVTVSLAADLARLPADAAAALLRARATGVRIVVGESHQAALGPQDLAIDALLGLGGDRAPEGTIARMVRHLNTLPCAVLAVDLPSGLDAESGQPHGEAAVRASHTLALLTLKPGLFTGAGRDHSGSVWLDSLGITPTDAPQAWLAGPVRARTPRRHAQHKGSFGDLLVVAGAPGMAGAALLAARAAHAAGAGRVWIAPLDPAAVRRDDQRPELMWHAGLGDLADSDLARLTVVCGCGGGEAVAAALPRLLDTVPRLVLDADGLNAVAKSAGLQAKLRARTGRGLMTVLTPHPLEAARLLGTDTASVQATRLASARALSTRFACVAVLKGSGTVIAAPGTVAHINASGNAALATPGTGDVLAGWLGGTWGATAARGVTGDPSALAFEAARSAIWCHGEAADRCGMAVLRAGDLIERLSHAAS